MRTMNQSTQGLPNTRGHREQYHQYRDESSLRTACFPALKKEKAAPLKVQERLKEQERLNTERKALKETMQGLSEAYRAIDEQMRQVQRQRQ